MLEKSTLKYDRYDHLGWRGLDRIGLRRNGTAEFIIFFTLTHTSQRNSPFSFLFARIVCSRKSVGIKFKVLLRAPTTWSLWLDRAVSCGVW